MDRTRLHALAAQHAVARTHHGVLTGNDSRGTFRPDSSITRAEASAILNRVLDASKRKTFTLESASVSSGSSFEVYFLDVGQADSALVLCDGHAMLIDGGNAADSQLVYTFLKNHQVNRLDYIVCTHAHEDHVGGLAGALNYAAVGTAYCPVTGYDSRELCKVSGQARRLHHRA